MVSLLGLRSLMVQPAVTEPLASFSCSRDPKPATVGSAADAVAALAIARATPRGATAADAMMVVLMISSCLLRCFSDEIDSAGVCVA
jgi:hypothetical protein